MSLNNRFRKINDTYAEINLRILNNNFKIIKNFVNGKSGSVVKICSIVKADAYGHGMKDVGKALANSGTDYLGTADYSESVILSDYLRKFKLEKTPILCLGILTEKKNILKVFSQEILMLH